MQPTGESPAAEANGLWLHELFVIDDATKNEIVSETKKEKRRLLWILIGVLYF